MRIKQIEIDNFKSFRSKTVIPFLDGFTTISGPNGSGKSNIVDSILFALGLSSSRTLRAEKLTDLINNNNSRREASVAITFVDDKDETKEFEIKRKIKEGTNGYTSTYYVNGHVSTLSETHKMLADYNVSPGCYNVMMQGDVTGIINMSPNERRKIIDELAGVAEFDRRIEQATKEIETVIDRIERSQIILTEIDTRLQQLSGEREHALKYQKLKEEKQTYVNMISLVKYADLKKSLALVQEGISDSTKEKAKLQSDIENLEKEIEKAKQTLDELNEKVKIKGEDEQISLTKQSETLKGEIFRKEQAIEFKQNRITENNNSVKKAHSEINDLLISIDDTQLKIENKQDQYKIIQGQLNNEQENLKKLIEESSDLNKTAQDFIHKRNGLKKRLEEAENKHGSLDRENLKLEEIITRLTGEITEQEAMIGNTDKEKADSISKKELLEKELRDLNEEKSACEKQLNNVIAEIKDLKADISVVDDKLQKYYRKLMQLEANQKAAEDFHLGKSVDTVLSAGIPGVHRTLAQLGQVDKEYSTALEIAMGNRMKCIVVDNESVATSAINLLKQYNAGRATFLPLNKLRYHLPTQRLPQYEGVIDFAINLIKFDDMFKNAFFYALGETLIVENIETAKPLMGEYRMVTLDGSLIEKTGAMTGGSVAKNNLKFASNVNEELDELNETVKKLEYEKSTLKQKLTELERKMERCRENYSGYLNQIHTRKLELDNVEKLLSNADETGQSRINKLQESQTRLAEAQKQYESTQTSLQTSVKEIEELKTSINDTDSNIPSDKLEEIEKLTGNIEFEIKTWESKSRNLEADISKITMEKDFKTKSLEFHKDKISESENENKKLESEIQDHKQEINVIQAKVNELTLQITSLTLELKEIQKERDLAAKAVFALQEQKDKSTHQIQRTEETINAYAQRKKELSQEITALKHELNEQNIDYSKASETNMTTEEITRTIDRLTRRMEALEPVNMLAITEYDEVLKRKDELNTRITTLSTEKTELHNRLNGYESMKKQTFMLAFDNIDNNFQGIFSELSDGIGRLRLENPEDVFKGGLIIEAQPRGKKLLRIEAMSGGEKSLTAMAFVFAFQKYMPAPFYAFDEVDMLLDGLNVEKLAKMIKEQSYHAQFIVVSHRKPMIEKADRTVGVTQRNDGITKVTGVLLHAG